MSVPWTRPAAGTAFAPPALIVLAVLAVPALPPALFAQEAASGGEATDSPTPRAPATELHVMAGGLAPLSDLARTEDGASLGLSSSFAAGLGAARWLDDRWGLAVDGLWATGGPDATVTQGGGTPGDGGQGADEVDDAGATYLAGTARVLYRLRGLAGVVEPQFGFGAGVRHVEMDPAEGFGAVSETDPVAVLSGAVRSPLSGGMALTVEMRDLISLVEAGEAGGGSELQNDILVLVGVSFRP